MRLLLVISESHRTLHERWFLPGLPGGMVPQSRHLDAIGEGNYGSEDWKVGLMAKLESARDFCHCHPGEVFALSDVDIQFFQGFRHDALVSELEQSGKDVLFQKECADPQCAEVNTGFYVARATPWLARLFGDAIVLAQESGERNDQKLVNAILNNPDTEKRWGHLPASYYARSHGFPPPPGIVLHHANMTPTVAEKIGQLRRVRSWVEGGRAAKARVLLDETLDYILAGKFSAMLRRRLGDSARGRSHRDTGRA